MKHRSHKGINTALMVVLGLVLMVGIWLIGSYNGLVTQDTVVEQKEADIESQLKRRADLVPNLVSTVKGYAKHEKEVFDNIAQARSRLLNADVGKNPTEAAAATQNFNGALGRLLAVAEAYPQLKADQNFIRLQDELSGTENRINYARLQFNEAIKNYNLKVRSFPTNIMAGMFGFERRQPFEASEAEKTTPTVNFD